jgi:rhamnosyltransferase subunit B
VHSPQCVICFFPEWFAVRQPDWPPRAHLVGFPLWDGGGGAPGDTGSSAMSVPAEAEEFLNAGEPPVVFTPGSAAATMQRFFAESVETALRLDVRAMLITNFQEQLPRDLPRNVKAFGYVPFSEVLPRAALLVYHGGIGTLAQTIRAGIPHLVVPSGHDQFDNAWRIEQLGLGLSVPQARYRSDRAARAIRSILADPRMIGQSRQYAAKTDSAAAVTRACELVEGLATHPTK